MLDRAAALVKPGGRIAYITCSVLPQENGEQIARISRRAIRNSTVVPPAQTASVLWDKADDFLSPRRCRSAEGLLMTPRRTGTDGFFVACCKALTAAGIRHARL